MARSPPMSIPAFYRVFFTSIDPLIALGGAYLSFFDPYTVIRSLFPESHPAYAVTPSHSMLLHQAGGAFATMAYLMVFMLRRTNDVAVWKHFEFGILLADFSMFYCLWVGLEVQGRFEVGKLRWEEWGSLGITGFVTVMRVLFIAGVGLGNRAVSARKRV